MSQFILPRPGHAPNPSKPPIPGPSEEAFTKTFGTLLPPAKYLNTINGKAAYYELPPSSSTTTTAQTPDRVLFLHGVQTPALGMFPLARALKTSFPNSHFVLIDLWGHGLSDTPIIPHEASLFHQLIDDLLNKLSWPSAHLVGFSFGGALTVGYVSSHPSKVQSFTLVAPAGLIHSSNLSDEQKGYLRDGCDEIAAQKWVFESLEGGDLIVPSDWKERVGRGEVVAPAVREWSMREHGGHVASVVAIFRDAGAFDSDATFLGAVGTKIPSLVVLGEFDGVVDEKELREIGFGNLFVVPGVGHGVVRERVPEVARFIGDFWKTLNEVSNG
jgi:pimeloyl-ACP methyl ester carboxylesterase